MSWLSPILGSALIVMSAQQSPPAFRAGVDLITIDVQVTSARDAPIRALAVGDFDVTISGRKRPAASATLLHHDEGSVVRNPSLARAGSSTPDCVFRFLRKANRPTAHYVVGVEATDADRREVTQVRVKMSDKSLVAQTWVWRAPVRREPMP